MASRDSAPLTPLWDIRRPPPAHLRPILRRATQDIADIVFRRPLLDVPGRTTREYAIAFRQLAMLHGVSALLGLRVEAGEHVLDDALSAWLREETAINRDRLTRARRVLDETLLGFSRRKIDAIPLKGAAMLLDGVEALAWRVVGDIDLLVGGASSRELDLAVAHAGYCLRGSSWKHRVYQACTPTSWSWTGLATSRDFPLDIELHPAVQEHFRGTHWDVTAHIRAGLVTSRGVLTPDDRAMALHLAIHASVSILEGFGRMIQLVDLERILSRVDADALLEPVYAAGPGARARFVFPAVALVARETGNPVARDIAHALRGHVPPALDRWSANVSLYDISYVGRFERRALDRGDLWATSRLDRARMLAATLAPAPAMLASEQFAGEGPFTLVRAYPRYYAGLLRRALRG